MTVTNSQSGTTIIEIGDRIHRISTPVPPSVVPGGFTFNQFLVVDEAPLLFHTGHRSLFPLVSEAIAHVMPVERLRYVGFSHHEPDEDGSLAEFLAAAPGARPLCGRIAAMLAGQDLATAQVLADGEELSLGDKIVRWIDAPQVPHGWDCGFLAETTTRTLFCGDLFTQPGSDAPALTEQEILSSSETMRRAMEYYARGPETRATIERIARFEPRTLACMHGSSYAGDGATLLRALADAVCAA